jgi:hypothetical protein
VTHQLDHAGILVPRLTDAVPLLARLGFTLTRRAEHRNADGSSAGSAQCSMMFESGYVEVQELADINGTHILAPAVRRNFGLHTLAFGVADAEAAREDAARAGLPATAVMEWARRIEEEDISTDARFAFFVANYDPKDDSFLCWVRHLTPEALRSARLVRHANGARALRAVVIATRDDPARLLDRYVACGGVREAPGVVRFRDGAVEVLQAAEYPPALARAAWPNDSWFAALRIGFDDPAAFADTARDAGYAVEPWRGAFVVDLLKPLGCVMIAT